MGAKTSSLSCANCRKTRSRYGVRSTSVQRPYHDSYYDPIGGSVIVTQRKRLGSTRTNRKASLNLVGLSHNEGNFSRQEYPQSSSRAPSCEYKSNKIISAYQHTCIHENPLSKLNKPAQECPEMSTISLGSGSLAPNDVRPSLPEECTPADVRRTDDVMFASSRFNSDLTDTTTTLVVPPNSVNSQFLSGITPLDDAKDEDSDATSESVFEPENPDDVFCDFHPNFPPPPAILLNNNSLPPASHWDFEMENSSIGPGFDSDFGASAGVEMKIVSSDNTAAESTPPHNRNALYRWIPPRGGSQGRKMSRKEILRDGQQNTDSITSSFSEHFRYSPYYLPFSSAPHSCPVTVPETPSLHVTMEWDPYDPTYNRWVEYIIPGVTYPSVPLLNERQYWL